VDLNARRRRNCFYHNILYVLYIVLYHLLPPDDNNIMYTYIMRGVRHTYYHILIILLCILDGARWFSELGVDALLFSPSFFIQYDCVCLFMEILQRPSLARRGYTVFGDPNTTLPTENRGELATTIINIIIIVTLCVHIIITHGVLCYKTGTPPCSIRGLLPSSFDNNYRRLEQHGRRLSIVCGAFVWFSS